MKSVLQGYKRVLWLLVVGVLMAASVGYLEVFQGDSRSKKKSNLLGGNPVGQEDNRDNTVIDLGVTKGRSHSPAMPEVKIITVVENDNSVN